MDSASSQRPTAGHPRKRVKRDTRSCYECRRRKVKCQLSTEDVPSCAECTKNGVPCSTREPDHEGSATEGADNTLERRLGRIENLLLALTQSWRAQQYLDEAQLNLPPGFSGLQATIDPVDLNSSIGFPPNGLDWAPTLPEQSSSLTNREAVRLSLIALLPSQSDADLLASQTLAWDKDLDGQCLSIAAISLCSSMAIARTLLSLALYIQLLPPNFNSTQYLEMVEAPEIQAERYISTVKRGVLADEELVCSPDGIECFLLLGVISLNDGAFRSAWLGFRRAVDVCRLLRLHESYSQAVRRSSAATADADHIARRELWLSAVMGDCYCSLLLGLEPGAGPRPFGLDLSERDVWDDPFADADANFHRRLCCISMRLSRRNLGDFQHDEFDKCTDDIEQMFDELENTVPDSYWRTPHFTRERTTECAAGFDRMLCHLWFFQLRAFAHLPYLLLSDRTTEREYRPAGQGSQGRRDRCLEASRMNLHRYLALRHNGNSQNHCRVLDFGAFIAAATLLLSLAPHNPDHVRVRRVSTHPDVALVEHIIQSMDALGRSSDKERIARQSVEILNALLRDLLPSGDPTGPMSGAGQLRDSELKKGLQELLLCIFRGKLGTNSSASRIIERRYANDARRLGSDVSVALDGTLIDCEAPEIIDWGEFS